MRIDKFLSACGKGTRTEVKKLLKQGNVLVNGHVVTDGKTKIDEQKDNVICAGSPIVYRPFVYYVFHKPKGCVCANHDDTHTTVFSYLPMNAGDSLFTVGRLDIDTEGLLLITNDGDFAHRLLSPKKHVDKTYAAILDCAATPEDVIAFENGIDIGDEKKTLPALLEIDEADACSVKITVSEGRFHQVKRMTHAVGKEIVYLKRLSMGKFKLEETLPLGAYREFTQEELDYVEEYKSGHI